ncbi:hypothetical protein B0T22DRAFT_280844 [Podospora appendiculata]|uniref:Leucine-rich repeat-containing protein n=1 Tax=Podospora appendiculata TaxID=314037 RepID=A0AAE1C7Y5_9PEZI|nr:hypothetical protein B0T22DRAFT_280844 [Podospora appendiculata]
MDDQQRHAKQPTGIPRPSKLPVQSSASKLPIPRSSSIRHSPSRETLATPGGTLRNPKLRAAPSRDQLLQNTTLTRTPQQQQPASAASHFRAVSSPQARAPLPVSQTPGSAPRTSRYTSNAASPQRPARTPVAQPLSQAPQPGSAIRTGPRRQPSQQWISATTAGVQEEASTFREPETTTDTEQLETTNAADFDTVRASALKPRPSLAERTIETLSQLPSSPSVRGKVGAASFYLHDTSGAGTIGRRRPSRPSSRDSRPGSSHQSSGSSRGPSRNGSRPNSSSGTDETISNFRASISTYKNNLHTIESTPLRARKSIHSLQSLQTPSAIAMPGRTVLASANRGRSPVAAAPAPAIPRSRTPSPEKRVPDVSTSRFGARTMGARPTKRPSINGLFRKPSVSTLNKATVVETTSRKISSASQRSTATSIASSIPSSASMRSASTALTTDSTDSAASLGARTSSAALREQIAKAKAAKRAALQQISATDPVMESEEPPLIPTDHTFDFGLNNDPFNQRRDDQSQAKVLQARLESARTSGRLNIAAMSLREIPAEVMNMYNLDSISGSGGAWAESVDLSRFVAADNEMEMISDAIFPDVDPQDMADDEDSQGNIFAGLETLDLHGNMLIALPMGLRRLSLLTSLNLSQNRLANNCLEVVSTITSLRDLKLGGNLFYGPLDHLFSRLVNLEILDLHGNNISSLPSNFGDLARLRVLNISENAFETLPFDILSTLPLTELSARKNQLGGILFQGSVEAMPNLKALDVSSNQLSHLRSPSEGRFILMPALHSICLSMNRLQCLPDVSNWTGLVTLAADENSINAIPEGFTSLQELRSADFSSNDIRVIPAEIGRMTSLATLRLSGNPLREKKFSSMDTDEMKTILAQRLEPPPVHLEPEMEPAPAGDHACDAYPSNSHPSTTHGAATTPSDVPNAIEDVDDSRSEDDFATPPTSAHSSPVRSRSHTLTGQTWPIKAGGILDRSNTQIASLHPVICSKVAANSRVNEIQLHHNLFTVFPDSLSFFAETLTALSLSHNQLTGEMYLGGTSGNEGLDLPLLKELNLASNHLTGLGPLVAHLRAPNLQKLDVSFNRISSLPKGTQLRDAFPNLAVLLMSNNHLAELEPESIKGIRIVDASNNDIAHLNPRLGLLGGSVGLEKLDVSGNRFRVPRFSVLERGTDATLRWLRGRVPVAEMGAWKGVDGDGEGHDTSLTDLD